MAEQWRIKGDFIDFCKCRVPCPCSWGRPPDEGDCDGVIAYDWAGRSSKHIPFEWSSDDQF